MAPGGVPGMAPLRYGGSLAGRPMGAAGAADEESELHCEEEVEGEEEVADYAYDMHDLEDEDEDEEEAPFDETLYDCDDRYDRYEEEALEVDEAVDDDEDALRGGWAHETDPDYEYEEGEEGYRDEYDDGEEGEEERLCSQDVEQLVERYVVTRRRCEELESENAKLTQQLLECASGQAPDTLVIQVSPEMW